MPITRKAGNTSSEFVVSGGGLCTRSNRKVEFNVPGLTFLVAGMFSSDLEIRPCQDGHIPDLAELWKEYMVDQGEDPLLPYYDLEASTGGFRKILEAYTKREPEGFLVASVGGEVVGFVVSFKDAFGPNYVTRKRIGQIQVVHVKRGFRRRGIATKLINAAFGYLEASGCSIVLAETGERNDKSMRMLEKLGFGRRGKLVSFMKEI